MCSTKVAYPLQDIRAASSIQSMMESIPTAGGTHLSPAKAESTSAAARTWSPEGHVVASACLDPVGSPGLALAVSLRAWLPAPGGFVRVSVVNSSRLPRSHLIGN
jgi:hypothetical protein